MKIKKCLLVFLCIILYVTVSASARVAITGIQISGVKLQWEDATPPPEPSDNITLGTTPITVSGAGTNDANGDYNYNSGSGDYSGPVGWILYFAVDRWIIETPGMLDQAYTNTGGDSGNIPKTGWAVVNGASPAPTLSE